MTPGFPCGSAGKESACSVGDLGLIPGLEDPLEEGVATHSSILTRRIAWQAPLSMGVLQTRVLEWVPCPPVGDLPKPGIKPRSPTLQVDSLPPEPPGKRLSALQASN